MLTTIALGIPLGLLAARRKVIESALDTMGGAVWALPTIIVCLIVFIGLKGQFIEIKFLFLGLFNWVPIYRSVRDTAKQVQVFPFVTFARAIGMSEMTVYITQILPNIMPTIFPTLLLNLISLFEVEFILSFLGLSYPDPIPTLGGILRQGIAYLSITMIMLPALLVGGLVMIVTLSYRRRVISWS
jgi:ABC-type dipeptide/oligopeptide/nickel transport system permease subunit